MSTLTEILDHLVNFTVKNKDGSITLASYEVTMLNAALELSRNLHPNSVQRLQCNEGYDCDCEQDSWSESESYTDDRNET